MSQTPTHTTDVTGESPACAGRWAKAWMTFAGRGRLGRLAMWIASWGQPPMCGRVALSRARRGRFYIARSAELSHAALTLAPRVFIDDRVLIYQGEGGGEVELAQGVHLHRECILQTHQGGRIIIGEHAHLQCRCFISAAIGHVRIGAHVEIAPYCCFYSYNHCTTPGELIQQLPLHTRGGVTIGDGAWLGVGVTVLDGVTIGAGAVVAAGAVVTRDVPDHAIVAGVPAKVIGDRRGQAG